MTKELNIDVEVTHRRDNRRGKVVEINTETGRARVAWPESGRVRRTWVRFSDLKAIHIVKNPTVNKPGERLV